MKSIKKKTLAVIASSAIAILLIAAVAMSATTSSYKVIARNDLGMHCACPTFEGFLLLPPFNTIRAQVLNGSSVVSSGVTVSYSIPENTDAILKADPYYASWLINAPKLFPGFQPITPQGNIIGITNKMLADTMTYDSTSKSYIAVGVPTS